MSVAIDECLDGLSSTVQMNFRRPDSFPSHLISSELSDENLRSFAETISITPSDLENLYKPVLRDILTTIHTQSGCAIDRYCVSGSLGIQPNNCSDDFGFDITVFLDCSASHGTVEESEPDPSKKKLHPECTIQSFEKIYTCIRHFASPHQPVECDHRGVHFQHETTGLFIHLAAFPSFGHRMHVQRKSIWDLVESLDRSSGGLNQNDLDRFSIGLCESTSSFMHMGDPVFHGLVRLARFWRSQVLNPSGAEMSTYAIALIMMRCIEDEKARGMSATRTPPVFPEKKIFFDFLTWLTQIDTLSLTWQQFYEPDLVPERHLATRPMIVDPVNPWRNIVRNMTQEQMEAVKLKANESLKKTTIGELFSLTTTATRGA